MNPEARGMNHEEPDANHEVVVMNQASQAMKHDYMYHAARGKILE